MLDKAVYNKKRLLCGMKKLLTMNYKLNIIYFVENEGVSDMNSYLEMSFFCLTDRDVKNVIGYSNFLTI